MTSREIGISGVAAPSETCDDRHCPFHGRLAVRGKLFEGRTTGVKARQTVTLQKETPLYLAKFKRYARSKSTIHAHLPKCMDVDEGDRVIAAECRPISKSVSFVVVEVRR